SLSCGRASPPELPSSPTRRSSDLDRLSNRELSRQRVLAVQAYLVERGVDKDMISIRFHGERYPVANNNTREGREKNRRVTLRLRSEEHTSELQSRENLVCRLLLEK